MQSSVVLKERKIGSQRKRDLRLERSWRCEVSGMGQYKCFSVLDLLAGVVGKDSVM